MVRSRTESKKLFRMTTSKTATAHTSPLREPIRGRVLKAAFTLFDERGFSGTSMLEIATRAQVSKRDLYARFANKHAVLAECIRERTDLMRLPLETDGPMPQNREALENTLIEFGVATLQTVCRPEVLTTFRLAIAESDRAPEIARALDKNGFEANHRALSKLLKMEQANCLVIAGDPAALATSYFSVLLGNLLIRLLMRVREAPSADEIMVRARAAAETLLKPSRNHAKDRSGVSIILERPT
jgi:AcrR family transcriptional regulator